MCPGAKVSPFMHTRARSLADIGIYYAAHQVPGGDHTRAGATLFIQLSLSLHRYQGVLLSEAGLKIDANKAPSSVVEVVCPLTPLLIHIVCEMKNGAAHLSRRTHHFN